MFLLRLLLFFWTIFVSQNFTVNRQLYTLFVWGKEHGAQNYYRDLANSRYPY